MPRKNRKRVKTMKIKVRYQNEAAKPIQQAHNGEWYDLRCAEDVRMRRGEFKVFSLGVSIELPKGYEALVAPRSSTFSKHGIILANSIGIIDNAYCGNNDVWKFPAICMRDYAFVPAGTRIAQFRIIPTQPDAEVVEVETLDNPDRNGMGSTGEK